MQMVREGRPPDGGWGWMVMAGAFLTLMVIAMFSLGYSILFSEFLMSHGASSTTIAWIFNFHLFMWNAVGVFTGPLTKEFGFRMVCMTCTFLTSVSLLLLVFADSMWFLFIFFALGGLFGGLAAKPCYLLLTLYFDRKRGRANAILMTGACVAQFVGPLLIRYLLAEYSLKGATLILAGIVFNSVVGTALFQPVEWHLKKDDVEEPLEEKPLKNGKDMCVADPDLGVTDEMRVKEAERRKMLGRSLSRRPSELSMLSLAVSNIDLSSITPCSRRGSFVRDTSSPSTEDNTKMSGIRRFLNASGRVLKAVLSDMKILKSPRALIIVFGSVICINVYINFLMTAPFIIQHLDYSLADAAWCMSLAAIMNTSSRLLISSLSDCSWFDIRIAYMIGALIVSLTTAGFGFLNDFTSIQITLAVWGIGVGITISLNILLMPRYMGADKTAAIFGVQSLCISISMITMGPIFGLIRDWSGSYPVTLMVMGCTGGISVLLWGLMPLAMAYDKRLEEKMRKAEQEVEGKDVLSSRGVSAIPVMAISVFLDPEGS